MRRFAVISLLAVLAVAVAASRPVPQELPTEDVAAIKVLFDAWETALENEDIDGCLSSFAENGVHIRPGRVTVSKDTLAVFMKGILGDRDEKDTDFGIVEIDGQGTLAFAWGKATEIVRYPDADEDLVMKFPWVCVLRKMEDGKWQVIAMII